MTIARRSLLKGGLATVGCASLCSSSCGNDVSPAPIADVMVDDNESSPTYGMIAVIPAMYPQLAKLGGAISLRIAALPPRTRPFSVPAKGILLLHRDPTDGSEEYVAVRSDCPHQGCPLGYSYKDDLVECPCHGSRFRASGDPSNATACAGLVVHPPAKDNLTVWNVVDQGTGILYVDLNTVQSCGVTGLPAVVNGTITFTTSEVPAIANVGGSVVSTPMGLGDTIIVARTDTATIVTLSAVCTHQGCTVMLDEPNMRMDCPCHGSEYSFDGTVLAGPAPSPLKSYPTTFDGTTVTINVT